MWGFHGSLSVTIPLRHVSLPRAANVVCGHCRGCTPTDLRRTSFIAIIFKASVPSSKKNTASQLQKRRPGKLNEILKSAPWRIVGPLKQAARQLPATDFRSATHFLYRLVHRTVKLLFQEVPIGWNTNVHRSIFKIPFISHPDIRFIWDSFYYWLDMYCVENDRPKSVHFTCFPCVLHVCCILPFGPRTLI
jgi:hypothetical protein